MVSAVSQASDRALFRIEVGVSLRDGPGRAEVDLVRLIRRPRSPGGSIPWCNGAGDRLRAQLIRAWDYLPAGRAMQRPMGSQTRRT
jgi:hypothetical protein